MQKAKASIFFGLSFLIIFVLTKINSLNAIDINLSRNIYNFLDNGNATSFFNFITDYTIGTYVGWLMVAALLLLKRKISKLIIFAAFSGATVIIVEIIKLLTQRVRPFFEFIDVQYLADNLPSNYSFPSGHTATAFFIAYFVTKTFKLNRIQTFLIYSLASLVGLSRIYLGAHYVLDVVAGAILGTLIGVIANPKIF